MNEALVEAMAKAIWESDPSGFESPQYAKPWNRWDSTLPGYRARRESYKRAARAVLSTLPQYLNQEQLQEESLTSSSL